jgi:hypothetical protein
MDTFLPTAVAAAGLFAAANADDMVVLAVLNPSSRASGRPKRWHIWAGQYARAALVIVSLAAGHGLTLVPERWLWLLGLLPLGLGIRTLVTAIRGHRSGGQGPTAAASGLPGVIAITIANGGDNLAAFEPGQGKRRSTLCTTPAASPRQPAALPARSDPTDHVAVLGRSQIVKQQHMVPSGLSVPARLINERFHPDLGISGRMS